MLTILPYDKNWPQKFCDEKQRLLAVIAPWVINIEHIGSTAVPYLTAKPTIDMCLVVTALNIADQHIIPSLIDLGYQYLPELEQEMPDRRYVQLLDSQGNHLYHIHIVKQNSQRHLNYLLFRDYLRQHPQQAQQYAELKRKLNNIHQHNRQAYTNGKTSLIHQLHQQAIAWQAQGD